MASTPKPIRKVVKKAKMKGMHEAKHKATHGSMIDEPGKHHIMKEKFLNKDIKKKGIDIGSHMKKHSKEDMQKAHKHMKEHAK